MKRFFNYLIKQKEYPENLLIKIQEQHKFEMPEVTDDIISGVEYAISTLQPNKAAVILGLYCDGYTYEQLSEKISISPGRIKNIEKNALFDLGLYERLMYILNGIRGCTNISYDYAKSDAYEYGYEQGFVEGVKRAFLKNPAEDLYFLSIDINALGLNTRCRNALWRHQCRTIGDVVEMDLETIKNIRNLGRSSAKLIAQTLEECGVKETAWSQFLD